MMRLIVGVMAAFACAGLLPAAPAFAAKTPSDFALGANGESQACRAQTRFDTAAGVQAADIYCGAWERPSGRVTRYGAAEAEGVLGRLAQDCKAAAQTTLSSADFTELKQIACISDDSDGLRRYALVARRGAGLVVGTAYPADWLPMLQAARVLSGAARASVMAADAGATPGLKEIQAVYPAGAPGQTAAVNHELLRRRAYENNTTWNFGAAERDFSELLRSLEQVAPEDLAGQAEVEAEIGLNLSGQRRFSEARDALLRAETLATRANMTLLLSKIGNYRALDLLNQRRSREALAAALEANRVRDALMRGDAMGDQSVSAAAAQDVEQGAGAGRRRSLVAPLSRITDKERAAVLSAQADHIAAVASRALGQPDVGVHLDRARARLNTVNFRPAGLVAQIYSERSRLQASRGDLGGAVREAQAGLALLQRESPGTRGEGHMMFVLAEARRQQGDLIGALREGRAATAIFARQREAPGMPADVAAPHLSALLQAAAPNSDPVLSGEYLETLTLVWDGAAARSAAQLAARLAAQESGDLVRKFQDAERANRAALARRERLSNNPDASPQMLRSAEAAAAEAADSLAKSEAAVRSSAPRYLELISPKVAAADLMGALQPGEAYLRLVMSDDGGFGALVKRDGVQPFRIALTTDEAEALVNRLRRSATTRNGRLLDYDLEAARTLYDRLLGPVSDALSSITKLQIDAGGPLAATPFAALVTRAPTAEQAKRISADQDYRGVAWLGRRMTVATALGPASFVRIRRNPPPAPRVPIVAFGGFLPDPVTAATRIAAERGLSDRCRLEVQRALSQLQALPDTNQEATEVAAAFGAGAKVSLGSAFTDSAVLTDPSVAEAGVLVLATHGILSLSNCFAEPALLVSVGADGDGLLDASELLNLSLRAHLVVLSACDTAGGGAADASRTGFADGGEALSGLARAFIYAGASSVLATHWKVDSSAASLQTRAFLTLAGANGAPLAAALGQAQAALYEQAETAHPFYWAGFVLIGDGSATLGKDSGQIAYSSRP